MRGSIELCTSLALFDSGNRFPTNPYPPYHPSLPGFPRPRLGLGLVLIFFFAFSIGNHNKKGFGRYSLISYSHWRRSSVCVCQCLCNPYHTISPTKDKTRQASPALPACLCYRRRRSRRELHAAVCLSANRRPGNHGKSPLPPFPPPPSRQYYWPVRTRSRARRGGRRLALALALA